MSRLLHAPRLTLPPVPLLLCAAPAAAATTIDYGPISHNGLKKVGTPSSGKKLPPQLGLIANQSGLQNAVKAAYDLATGWGSPVANTVAGLLAARG